MKVILTSIVFDMNYQLNSPKSNTVKVCKKDVCIEANGKNADMLTGAATFSMLLFGIAALVAAFR